MEDRHSISEPRPIRETSRAEWEVDILRDDTLVVDTFVINDEVLPPRTGKKGKVLWRLPDTVDKLPAFAKEDRRRILDIFKERKKRRKQEKKKRQDSDGTIGEEGNTLPEKPTQSSKSEFDETGGGRNDDNLVNSDSLAKKQNCYVHKDNGANNNLENNGLSNTFPRENSTSLSRPPPGLSDLSAGANVPKQNPAQPDLSRLTLDDERQSNNQQLKPPPVTETSLTPDDVKQPSKPLSKQQHEPPPVKTNDPPAPSLIPADAAFIIVPKSERPDPLPGEQRPSLSVPAARHFIALYYAYLENASPSISIINLCRFYTTNAQKSISLGGAHSVVNGRNDITAQILSLAGSSFLVRGVVAQDAYDRHGVHILVNGTAKTAGGVFAFAHSVSLSPVTDASSGSALNLELMAALDVGYPFQIHNDALAFLNIDAMQLPPQPHSSPPQPQKQHPPPSPGMI